MPSPRAPPLPSRMASPTHTPTCSLAMAPSAWQWIRVTLDQPVLPRHILERRHTPPFVRACSRRRTLAALLLFVVGYIYLGLLVTHGSISPLATAVYTSAFDGRAARDFPPPTWKPGFRVVVSLTTTPNRLDKVMDSVNSLLQQTLVPDQIYVNIPEGRMKRHPERSYDETKVPEELDALKPIVKINRCVDDGPATKLIGALRQENESSTLIITVDDDFQYPPRLVEALAWEAEHRPKVALGVCGWGVMPVPFHSVGVVPAYVPYFMRPYGRYVDILQACCGNAYRREFFNDIDDLARIPSTCVTVDDVWIAGYLKTKEKRKTAIISKRLDPKDPVWKYAEAKSEVAKKMKLSEFNHENQVHYKCMQAMEARLGKPWVKNWERSAEA